MSQSIRFVIVNDVVYDEIFSYSLTKDEIRDIVEEMIDNGEINSNRYDVAVPWYIIGNGETGDELFDEQDLIEWMKHHELEKRVSEKGYSIDHADYTAYYTTHLESRTPELER